MADKFALRHFVKLTSAIDGSAIYLDPSEVALVGSARSVSGATRVTLKSGSSDCVKETREQVVKLSSGWFS